MSRGETVEITVENNLDKSIWYLDGHTSCTDPNKGYRIYKFLNEKWIDVTPPVACPPMRGAGQLIYKELKFNNSVVFTWDLKILDKVKGSRQASSGKYKILVMYKESEKVENLKEIYSNEFTIKEKSALDVRCNEKVRKIGNCHAYFNKVGYEFDSNVEKCVEKIVVGSGCSTEIPFGSLEECQEVCEKKENDISLIWRKVKDGRWTVDNMVCMKKGMPPSYLCRSNCYEKSNEKIWRLCENKGDVTYTNTGVEVLCFSQGCFPEPDDLIKKCQLICPG